MKNSNIIAYLIFGALLVLQACTKDFEKINTPPTSLSTMYPGLLLANAQKDASFSEGYEYPNNQYGSWVQQWAGGVLISSSRYIQQTDDNVWSDQIGRAHV